jgi:hypothetical protein
MEHEDDLRIREKVRAHEQTPGALDKDRLWSGLALPGSARPAKRIAVYYAAASLILAAAVILYSLELTHRKALELRLAEIELSLKQVPVSETAIMNPVAQEVACPEAEQRPKPQLARRTNLRKPVVVPQNSTPQESADALAPVVALHVAPEPSLETITNQAPVTQTIEDQHAPVKVILGKSLSPSSGTKQGRLTFRLFPDEDNKSAVPLTTTPVVTLAGINN